MQRYFIATEQFGSGTLTIDGDDAHHLSRVMRAVPGDKVICCDGKGRSVLAAVTLVGKDEVTAEIVEELAETNEAALDVWIAQSLPKGDKLETVIQKCTEVGAAGFLPFLSERTIVQYDAKKEEKRRSRWQKIAKEAAEQAHRSLIPEVTAPLSWKELLRQAGEADLALICYELEDGMHLRSLLTREAGRIELSGGTCVPVTEVKQGEQGIQREQESQAHPTSAPTPKPRILVIVGPEGGFSEREIAEATSAGCLASGLGRRILRTETAGLVALACILYEYGEMGGC
jgi:16S rRNA (uracil1498-N3)-methyltransferase